MTEHIQPATQSCVIRVFVSSTFRDMQAERDELVKYAFPQLRKLCEQRGVTWGEVDLRWGITDEQRAEGQVLPLCLQEIHRRGLGRTRRPRLHPHQRHPTRFRLSPPHQPQHPVPLVPALFLLPHRQLPRR